MRTFILLFAVLSAALAVANSEDTRMEQQILSKMHHLNQMEIEVGQLAQQKADAVKVKRYGERLVRDHRLGDSKVTALAQQLGVTLVAPEPATDQEKQKMQMQMQTMEKLKGLTGKEFDETFLQAMISGHEDAINMLRGAEGQLSPSPLRNLIAKMLPILQQHYDLAVDLQRSGK